MTTLSRAPVAPFPTRTAPWAGLLQKPFQAAIRYFRIQRGRHALGRLSDHTLKDIGLRRCDIDSVVRSLVDETPDTTRVWRDYDRRS